MRARAGAFCAAPGHGRRHPAQSLRGSRPHLDRRTPPSQRSAAGGPAPARPGLPHARRHGAGQGGPGGAQHGHRGHGHVGRTLHTRIGVGGARLRPAGDGLRRGGGDHSRRRLGGAVLGPAPRAVLLLRVVGDDPLPVRGRSRHSRRALRGRGGIHGRRVGLRLRVRGHPGHLAGVVRGTGRRHAELVRAAVPLLHQPDQRRPERHPSRHGSGASRAHGPAGRGGFCTSRWSSPDSWASTHADTPEQARSAHQSRQNSLPSGSAITM